MISYSHTHFNLDAKNQNYTVRFAGTKNLPGLGGGVPTLSAFDEEMKNSFKTGNFTLKRKVALLHLSQFFFRVARVRRLWRSKEREICCQAGWQGP
jgi:hypothetical protein